MRTSTLLGAALLAGLTSGCPQQDDAEVLEPCQNLGQLRERAGSRIGSSVPGAGTLGAYAITSGSSAVTAQIPNPCGDAIAARLQESACGFCNSTPTRCESLVVGIFETPPAECSACGDGICTGLEDRQTCPEDCSINCGDGMCEEVFGENEENCALDCAQPCGDTLCAGLETNITCPQDCNYSVGDNVCSYGETPLNSFQDCTGETCMGDGTCANTTCGDRFCQSYETTFACPEDCCDAVCDPGEELGCAGDNIVRCKPDGLGNCPEIEQVESCPYGCVAGACRDCPWIPGMIPCEGPASQRCDDSSGEIVFCQPMPGVEGCFVEARAACPEGCTEQGCTESCAMNGSEGCTLGTRRCLDGVRLQACEVPEGSTCPTWLTREVCVGELRCDHDAAGLVCADGDVALPDEELPTIDDFSPRTAAPGDVVTITGENLGDEGSVVFTDNQLAEVVSWSPTRITARVPDEASSGAITVVTPNGTVLTPTIFTLPPEFTGYSACGSQGYPMYLDGTSLPFELDVEVVFSPDLPGRVTARLQTYFEVEVPFGAQSGPLAVRTPTTSIELGDFRVLSAEATRVPTLPNWPMPDSPGLGCVNADGPAECPAEGEPFYGQDGTITTTPPNLTPIGEGAAVRDEVTGLTWQRVAPPAYYRWTDARCVCDALELEGMDDWRMPSPAELLSIADLAQEGGYLVEPFETPEFSNLWTGMEYLTEPGRAWFFNGRLLRDGFTRANAVLCVHGDTPAPETRYTVEGDVMTDVATGLMWPWVWDFTSGPWSQGLQHCEALELGGFNDWHMPTYKELMTIADLRVTPHADPVIFQQNRNGLVSAWSSTPMLTSPPRALFVDLSRGQVGAASQLITNNAQFICVRTVD